LLYWANKKCGEIGSKSESIYNLISVLIETFAFYKMMKDFSVAGPHLIPINRDLCLLQNDEGRLGGGISLSKINYFPEEVVKIDLIKNARWDTQKMWFEALLGRKDLSDAFDPITCDIVDPSSTVSRRHTTLFLEQLDGRWRALLRDGYVDGGKVRPSTNGTFLNNNRCAHETLWVRKSCVLLSELTIF